MTARIWTVGRRILAGWGRSLRGLGLFLTLAGGAALVSLLLTLPLWYAATHYRSGYTLAVLAALGAAFLLLFGRRFMRSLKRHGSLRGLLRKGMLPALAKLFKLLASAAVVYGLSLLYARQRYTLAAILSLAALLAFGFIKYGRGDRSGPLRKKGGLEPKP